MQQYDRSSKWLVEHHGGSILRLKGLAGILSCRAVQAEVVQPRQSPDGLLEVRLADRPGLIYFLVEIATFPERRVYEQMCRDAMLVFLDRGVLPEVLTLVLAPKGVFHVEPAHDVVSPLGWTRFNLNWQVVELWNVPAEQLLAAGDVGLIPWVPLAQFEGPPEPMLRECRKRIDQQATGNEHANLLAVTQVLARLRYNEPELLSILGGKRVMIESPFFQELLADPEVVKSAPALQDLLADPEVVKSAPALQRLLADPEFMKSAPAVKNLMADPEVVKSAPALQDLLADPEFVKSAPAAQELIAQAAQQATRQATQQVLRSVIVQVLEARFGPIPGNVAETLRALADEPKLRDLAGQAAVCPDLPAFRARLSA